MATPTANQQAAPNSDKSGQTKRLILIVAIAILAAGAAAAGTFYLMQSRMTSTPASAAMAQAPSATPLYFALEPMTVNLQSDDGESHYLRVGITLKLDNQATQDVLQAHTPEIRSRVLLALSNKHPSDLSTLEGKRALATELEGLIATPTEAREMPLRVDDVLFTEFVVQ